MLSEHTPIRGYHNNQPITENESSADQLNRETFAVHFAKVIPHSTKNDCRTISLEGEWGF